MGCPAMGESQIQVLRVAEERVEGSPEEVPTGLLLVAGKMGGRAPWD